MHVAAPVFRRSAFMAIHYPLPVVMFGHAAGRFAGNEHVMAAPRTPMTNSCS